MRRLLLASTLLVSMSVQLSPLAAFAADNAPPGPSSVDTVEGKVWQAEEWVKSKNSPWLTPEDGESEKKKHKGSVLPLTRFVIDAGAIRSGIAHIAELGVTDTVPTRSCFGHGCNSLVWSVNCYCTGIVLNHASTGAVGVFDQIIVLVASWN
jgi:hypothetical protein